MKIVLRSLLAGGIHRTPGFKIFDRQLRGIITIEKPPNRGHKNIDIIQEGEPKPVEISDLMRILINTDLTLDTTNDDKEWEDRLSHKIEIVCQTAKGNVHVIIGLGEHIDTRAVMTVEFEELDCFGGKVLELAIIVFDGRLIDDDLTILNLPAAKVGLGVQLVGTQDRDIGIDGQRCFRATKENLNKAVVWELLFQTITERFSGSEFCKVCGIGSFTGAGNTKEDTDDRGIIKLAAREKDMTEENDEGKKHHEQKHIISHSRRE